ncbi:MAG: amino acid carrier protein [Gammaproteobacteria bacterium]
MTNTFTELTSAFVNLAWGPWLVIFLVGSGLFFTIYSGFVPLKKFGRGFFLLKGGSKSEVGSISKYQALATSLSGTIGLGNIAGVALAIKLAGPGAIFWMWVTAIVGMGTKFFTCSLAVMYREQNEKGDFLSGPMYVIKNAMPKQFLFLAYFFAFFGMIGALPALQSNQIVQIFREVLYPKSGLSTEFQFNLIAGLSLATIAGFVILGGLKRIANFSSWLVPFMGGLYVFCALLAGITNFSMLDDVFLLIVSDAFTGKAVAGGSFMGVLIYGIQRGAYSNEAGIGTEAMVHGSAKTNSPIDQGMIAMLGPVFDTLIVCTATAIIILLSGVWMDPGLVGVGLTAKAFEELLGPFGLWCVFFCALSFGISTIFTYSYYGSACSRFIFGDRFQKPYLWILILCVVVFSVASLEATINIIDGSFAMMAIPTLVSTIYLAPKIKSAYKNLKI